ncbi:MAG TPA: type II secretion system F family protein [Moraxellaceae bacterium]
MALLLFSVMLALLLSVTLIALQWRHANSEKQIIRERFSGEVGSGRMGDQVKKMALAAGSIGAVENLRQRVARDSEVARMLEQAGVHTLQGRSLYYSVALLSPVLLVACIGFTQLFFKPGFESPWLMALMALIAGMLLPKRLLSMVAARRCEDMKQELPIFVQTLRILFDSGLAVEQSLRVITREAGEVFPNVAAEIERALQRAGTGLDLADELARVAEQIEVDEFTDTVSILRQMIRQGGSARTSLLNLQKLIEDRQLSAMQEKVTKLSAKMAIVMILFLFPALFILLAAPGFMALSKAIGGIS